MATRGRSPSGATVPSLPKKEARYYPARDPGSNHIYSRPGIMNATGRDYIGSFPNTATTNQRRCLLSRAGKNVTLFP